MDLYYRREYDARFVWIYPWWIAPDHIGEQSRHATALEF